MLDRDGFHRLAAIGRPSQSFAFFLQPIELKGGVRI
ncbi:hypothetical protein CLOLEP_02663 [[Clostridium] leptum DSM 753]|uniref:Uncharacterized protein n=1 Tax=[Clostridium] leptum DSM 753 TaxID=428125 RepID=A7VVQ1_9FIRM|nr:hypothetical protein CLOLEP_02663 [[Clostridium] leptum DSM 753]